MTWSLSVVTEPGRVYAYELTLPRFPAFGGRMIYLPRGPVIAIEEVWYVGQDGCARAFPPDAYHVDLENNRIILRREAWPRTADRPDAVTIRYRAGHCPDPLPDRDPLRGH